MLGKLKTLKWLAAAVIATAMLGCEEKPKDLSVAVNVSLNGEPLAGAVVTVDGQPFGVTNQQGDYVGTISRKYQANVQMAVSAKVDGYRTDSWQESFLFTKDSPLQFAFKANLKGVPYVNVSVKDNGNAVADARILFNDQDLGVSGPDGTLKIDMAEVPKEKVAVKVTKQGYAPFTVDQSLVPGATVEAALVKLFSLRIQTNTEIAGARRGLKGAVVMLGDKKVGHTNDDGTFVLTQSAKAASLALSLQMPGYLPEKWQTKIDASKDASITRYFYSKASQPVRLGVFRFASNTAGEDIGDVPYRFQTSVEEEVAAIKGFNIVDSKKVMDLIRLSKTSVEKLASAGWKDTPLEQSVDAILFGSVARDTSGRYSVEVKIFGSDGKVLVSKLAQANGDRGIKRAAKEIGVLVKDEYPFGGLVVAKAENRFELNFGEENFPVEKKEEFAVANPVFDKQGRITSYAAATHLKLVKLNDKNSLGETDAADEGKVEIGARVTRRPEMATVAKEYAVIAVKSLGDSQEMVSGANIYLDERWVASTGADGKARVPVRLNKSHDIVVYKHGFGQKSESIKITSAGELKEVSLESYSAKLRIDTGSVQAKVFVDNQMFATTPMEDFKSVPSGFHTIKLSAGGQYRDWEEVREFSTEDVDWTGPNAITLHIDYLKQGEELEQRKDLDGAIAAYKKAEKGHPDYAEAHHRLAQIYLDAKNDPDAAIAEYEILMTIPEVRELIFKQYAVAYTNMGHAYHEKANQLLNKDKEAAIKLLAKAVKSLRTAKENARFFPSESYDEAIHDTYYYLALSYQKLYQISKKESLMNDAELAWRDFLDFFPEKLRQRAEYKESLNAADRYMELLKKGG